MKFQFTDTIKTPTLQSLDIIVQKIQRISDAMDRNSAEKPHKSANKRRLTSKPHLHSSDPGKRR
jgi:hypothetical protein|tara:strand:- start:719 stop:910 length:192 start_codon:yes stop_codon:yes gene_type:complete